MNPLYIYFLAVNQVTLTGEDDTVIQGCRYSPGKGKVSLVEQGEVIDEEIDVLMEGTAANIDAKVFAIEKFLEIANQATIKSDYVYLRFYDGSTYDWKSRIIGGSIEFQNHGLKDRDNESQWAKLHVRRLNYWAGSKRAAPVFAAATADPATLPAIPEIYGHSDADHANYFGVDGHSSVNDLTTPLEIWVVNPYTADQIQSITFSERVLRGTTRVDAGWIEGESLEQGSGATRTVTVDALCSAGNYGSFAWNSTDEVQLATWAITGADLAILRGQVQRGLVRLRDVNEATDLWLRLKIMIGSLVVAESIWMLVPASTKYVELPPIAIPPGLPDQDLYQSVTLAIYVHKISGGAAALAIDFIRFVPAESIRKLYFLGANMTMGASSALVDSGIEEATYFKNADGTKAISHKGMGNYLMLYPGYDSIIHFTHRAGGDSIYNAFTKYAIVVYYEPRRRNL